VHRSPPFWCQHSAIPPACRYNAEHTLPLLELTLAPTVSTEDTRWEAKPCIPYVLQIPAVRWVPAASATTTWVIKWDASTTTITAPVVQKRTGAACLTLHLVHCLQLPFHTCILIPCWESFTTIPTCICSSYVFHRAAPPAVPALPVLYLFLGYILHPVLPACSHTPAGYRLPGTTWEVVPPGSGAASGPPDTCSGYLNRLQPHLLTGPTWVWSIPPAAAGGCLGDAGTCTCLQTVFDYLEFYLRWVPSTVTVSWISCLHVLPFYCYLPPVGGYRCTGYRIPPGYHLEGAPPAVGCRARWVPPALEQTDPACRYLPTAITVRLLFCSCLRLFWATVSADYRI